VDRPLSGVPREGWALVSVGSISNCVSEKSVKNKNIEKEGGPEKGGNVKKRWHPQNLNKKRKGGQDQAAWKGVFRGGQVLPRKEGLRKVQKLKTVSTGGSQGTRMARLATQQRYESKTGENAFPQSRECNPVAKRAKEEIQPSCLLTAIKKAAGQQEGKGEENKCANGPTSRNADQVKAAFDAKRTGETSGQT